MRRSPSRRLCFGTRFFAILLFVGCASSPERRAEDCTSYAAAVRPALRRIVEAADRFGDSLVDGPDIAARASLDLAVALEREGSALGSVAAGRATVGPAHERLLDAVGRLAQAMRFLGEVLAAHDETRRTAARTRLTAAQQGWRLAVEDVRRACPF